MTPTAPVDRTADGEPARNAAPTGQRVAVLGATGFIGRHVAASVLARGDTALLTARDLAPLHATFAGERVPARLRRVDARDPGGLEKALSDFSPTIVLNLTGYGVDRAERDAGDFWTVNADFPGVVARWAARANAVFVHVGSALEYGRASGDLVEDTSPLPTTDYGRSKLAGTLSVAAVAQQAGARLLTARLFTVYGHGEHPGRLLPTLASAAASGAPVPLTSGEQRRDFAYVEDVAEGLLRLADVAPAGGTIVNLATGVLHTVRDFVECAATALRLAPEQLRFGAVPQRPEEMQHDAVNVSRLRSLTGWTPDPSLERGLARYRAREGETDQRGEQA